MAKGARVRAETATPQRPLGGKVAPPAGGANGIRWDPRVLLVLAALGVAARLGVALVSWGTYDATTFFKFAAEVDHAGLLAAYRNDDELNHPPIPMYWAWAAYRLSGSDALTAPPASAAAGPAEGQTAGADDAGVWFSFVFKLPVILADAVTAWLLWRLWRNRAGATDPAGGPAKAAAVAAAFAWAPASVLVSGYHCNTDPVYATLCLASVYLIADRGWHFWGGVALAAAINVKLTPVLLIPPLLLGYRRPGEAARFLAGLSLGVLPFLPLLYHLGPRFYRNVLAYNSNLDRWGVNAFLLPWGGDAPDPRAPGGGDHPANRPAHLFLLYARYLIFAGVLAWAAAARFLRRWDRYEVAAVTFALSLVFTGGFGLQYTIILLPLLFAARPGFASLYGAAAGVFLLLAYFVSWTGDFPLKSEPRGVFPPAVAAFGLAAWGLLAWFVVKSVVRTVRAGAASSGPSQETPQPRSGGRP